MRWGFISRAMCVDMSASIFDATQGPDVLEALKACAVCPVKRECEDHVRPRKSYFDGVCGGKVWQDGRRIDGTASVRWQQTILLLGEE